MIKFQVLQERFRVGLIHWKTSILPGSIVITGVILVRFWGGLQVLEWMAFDRMLRDRPAEAIDERILIVGINEADLKQLNTYPITDGELANLIQTLQADQPAAIGVDIFRDQPVKSGYQSLQKVFQTQENVIGIERLALDPAKDAAIKGPPDLPRDRIGFVNAILDRDGSIRRSLLFVDNAQGETQLSLTIVLAERFLEQYNMPLEPGIRDPRTVGFGKVEIPRFQGNTGSYAGRNSEGLKTLINVRSGPMPFRMVSLSDVKAKRVKPEWVRGKVVLVGMVAESSKDYVTSHAIESANPALIQGVTMQAHAVSQLISAAIEGRPLLRGWLDGWEYLWIAGWGGIGIVLGWVIRSPLKLVLGLMGSAVALVGLGYGLILIGWWIPVVPPLLVFWINGAGLTAFYRYDQELRSRIRERQAVINETFDAIHNGPLQTLSQLQRRSIDEELSPLMMQTGLQALDREVRGIYESMRQQIADGSEFLYISQGLRVNLQEPMHEVLRQVYEDVLVRDGQYLQGVRLKLVDFQPLDERFLDLGMKRDLCRFLEEAITNVGKHGVGARRLEVDCGVREGVNRVRVADNGQGEWTGREGMGTQQAKRLAKRLRGTFERSPGQSRGMVCQLSWKAQRRWFG